MISDEEWLWGSKQRRDAVGGHVPNPADWTVELDNIKARLAAIESAAAAASIPQFVVEELKNAIDHCRTTLWAAMLSTQTTYEGSSLIIAARIQRVQEMCCRIRRM